MPARKKNEFDKDYIFNLIMPSEMDLDDETMEVLRDETIYQEIDNPSEPLPDEEDNLSILKSKLFAHRDGLTLNQTQDDLVLINIMENLVVERLDVAFDKFKCCKCDKCKKDVAALALNSLPAKYVLADPDDLSDALEGESTKEVSGAIIKAILEVKNNPKH